LSEETNPESMLPAGGQPANDRPAGTAGRAPTNTPAATVGGVASALMNLFRRAQRASQPATSTSAAAPVPLTGNPPVA